MTIPFDTFETVCAIGIVAVAFIIGLVCGMDLRRKSSERAYDDGWNSRGIHDWQQSMAKRDAKGRFAGKPKL